MEDAGEGSVEEACAVFGFLGVFFFFLCETNSYCTLKEKNTELPVLVYRNVQFENCNNNKYAIIYLIF